MKAKKLHIGLKTNFTPQKTDVVDRHCPYFGSLKVHGMTQVGKVVRTSSHKTATVEWETIYYIPKYERYAKRRTRVHVHNPPSVDAQIGDTVVIAQCKPISKTKHFVIIDKK